MPRTDGTGVQSLGDVNNQNNRVDSEELSVWNVLDDPGKSGRLGSLKRGKIGEIKLKNFKNHEEKNRKKKEQLKIGPIDNSSEFPQINQRYRQQTDCGYNANRLNVCNWRVRLVSTIGEE